MMKDSEKGSSFESLVLSRGVVREETNETKRALNQEVCDIDFRTLSRLIAKGITLGLPDPRKEHVTSCFSIDSDRTSCQSRIAT